MSEHKTRRSLALLLALGALGATSVLSAVPVVAQDQPTPPDAVAEFTPIEPGIGEGLTIGFTQLALGVPFPKPCRPGWRKPRRWRVSSSSHATVNSAPPKP